MEKESKDIDIICYEKHLNDYVNNLKELIKNAKFDKRIAKFQGSKNFKFEVIKENSVRLSQGYNKGKELKQLKIEIGVEVFDLDVRATDNRDSIEDDLTTRDFTINSLYMYCSMDKSYLVFKNRVRFC